jgi:hypothetical protein
MYRLTEAVWFPGASATGAAEAPAAILIALVVLAATVVAAGLGNGPIVERLLLPASAGIP